VDLAEAFQALRRTLELSPTPLNVILTASGDLNLDLPVFASGQVEALILTTPMGAERLRSATLPARVWVPPGSAEGRLTAAGVLAAIADHFPNRARRVLVEGGPQVMGDFLGERLVDELFLTLAPQVVGRDANAGTVERPGLVSGRLLAPDAPLWSTLASVHRADSHLFLRYALNRDLR
jgi:riboflavin biosynthesis pyrimidine reductase